jgi:DNA-binding SARP family transcriptional activator
MLLLRTLGSVALLELTTTGARQVEIQPRRLALLVFLVRGSRGPCQRRDVLLSLFWPDADEHHGRGVLRQALSALRKQLGAETLVTHGDDEVGIAGKAVQCDATDFEAACLAGTHQAALALYQDDFLSGFHASGVAPEFEQWVDGERSRLRRLAATAAWAMAQSCEAGGRTGDAMGWARRALELAPDDETGVARLIGLLDRSGDRAGALTVYAQLERRLAEEFSAAPAPETRALMQRLRQRPATATAATDTVVVAAVADVSGTAPASPNAQAARPRLRGALVVAGAIGALAIVALASMLGLVADRPSAGPQPVAVMPFRVNAADTSFSWLREGMVDLLTIRLAGEGGMPVIEPGAVLAAWHRALQVGEADAPEGAMLRAARDIGAGRAIEGGVTGSSRRLVITASLRLLPGADVTARAQVEGPPDSLPYLVDRLAAHLLGTDAGIERDRIPGLISASLPAVRAFLLGREAFRSGRHDEAFGFFRDAMTLDSTFALAGLDMARAAGWATKQDGSSGLRLARAHLDRLGPGDRALLDVMTQQWTSAPEMFDRWTALVGHYPGRPETWYGLGDAYFHWGQLAGIDGALERAEEAFRRGWELESGRGGDSAFMGSGLVAEPMEHMLQIAHSKGDTAEVRRLAARVLSADSSSDLGRAVRWHLAVLEGPSARQDFWERLGSARQGTTMEIVMFIVWTGMGAEDYRRAAGENIRRLRLSQPGFATLAQRTVALLGGRPSDAPRIEEVPGYARREGTRRRVRTALWSDGDTASAVDAVRELRSSLSSVPSDEGIARAQNQDICTVGLWDAMHGDLAAMHAASRRLKALLPSPAAGLDSSSYAHYNQLCLALLEASRASILAGSDALEQIGIADSLARTFIFEVCCGEAVSEANLLLARLWEAQGDVPKALRAIRRRGSGYGLGPAYLSSFLREEGRLSALDADTAAAIRAYRHYLALRPDPEPALQPQDAQIRRELSAMLAAHSPIASEIARRPGAR